MHCWLWESEAQPTAACKLRTSEVRIREGIRRENVFAMVHEISEAVGLQVRKWWPYAIVAVALVISILRNIINAFSSHFLF